MAYRYSMASATKSRTPASEYVVGVDFGTTFTSVAFVHTATPNEIKIVQNWPRGSTGNNSSYQVPTEIHYTDPLTREFSWGYEASKHIKGANDSEQLKWFKVLLQNPVQDGYRGVYGVLDKTAAWRTRQTLQQLDILPVTAVGDFLRGVRNIAIESMERTYGANWIRNAAIKYVLTIPAIWSDTACDLMVQAAEAAGFGTRRVDFHFVAEPEAAAAYTLKTMQQNTVKSGDFIVICDAGGGTVDLISYKIVETEPLKVVECVAGDGGLCGSIYLDERFEEYIRKTLGNKIIDSLPLKSKAEMMRLWEERVKFTFGHPGMDEDEYEVIVPGDHVHPKIEEGFHTISNESLQAIFDPVVDRIIKLVEKQVISIELKGENVTAILLLGGFGASEYLLARLQKEFKDPGSVQGVNVPGKRNIQILQPINSRTAIARGAVLRGMDGSIVVERLSRRHYGFCSSRGYLPGMVVPERHVYYNHALDSNFVSGYMTWYIKRKEVYIVNRTISFAFVRIIPVKSNIKDYLVFNNKFYACDLDLEPDYIWKAPEAVYPVCTVTSDLSEIPASRFKKTTRPDGYSYYRIEYELRMSISGEIFKIEWALEGTVMGNTTIKFE